MKTREFIELLKTQKTPMFGVYVDINKIAKKLTEAERSRLPDSAFALPGRRYPIHDLAHAKNALARVSQYGTPEEREIVRRKVFAKYPELRESFKERYGESPNKEEVLRKHRLGELKGEESEAKSERYKKLHNREIRMSPIKKALRNIARRAREFERSEKSD